MAAMGTMALAVDPPEAIPMPAIADACALHSPAAMQMAATGIMNPPVDPPDAIPMPAIAEIHAFHPPEVAQIAATGSTAPAVDPPETIPMPAMPQPDLVRPNFLHLPRESSAAFYPHSALLPALPPMPPADPPALPPTPPADPPAPLAPQAHRVPLPGRSMHLPVPPPADPPAAPAPPAHLPPLPGRLIRVLIRGRPEVEPCLGPPAIPPYPWPPPGGVHPDDDEWVCMDVSMLPGRNVEERNGGVAEPTPQRLRERRLPRGPHDKRPRP